MKCRINFKNLISDALDPWRKRKVKFAPHFEGLILIFKESDVNAPRFHAQESWAFGLSR